MRTSRWKAAMPSHTVKLSRLTRHAATGAMPSPVSRSCCTLMKAWSPVAHEPSFQTRVVKRGVVHSTTVALLLRERRVSKDLNGLQAFSLRPTEAGCFVAPWLSGLQRQDLTTTHTPQYCEQTHSSIEDGGRLAEPHAVGTQAALQLATAWSSCLARRRGEPFAP